MNEQLFKAYYIPSYISENGVWIFINFAKTGRSGNCQS